MNFSCLCCSVKFASAEIQKSHYKTDWHRYNLKRKIIELAPLTAEEFDGYVMKTRFLATETERKLYCNHCGKQFGNQKSFDNHLNSKKHDENVHKFSALPKTSETITDCEMKNGDIAHNWICADNQTETDCIFCDNCSNDIVDNLAHMSSVHSFFIPHAEFCTDVKALITYLQKKVLLFFCLWCNGKQFRSLTSARQHMIEKGHCQMKYDSDEMEEYSEFYDYSSSYPDNVEGMDIDEEIIPSYFDGDEYELILPSGASIGHRSLLRYYKQRLNPNPTSFNSSKLPTLMGSNSRSSSKNELSILRRGRDAQLMARILARTRLHISMNANNVKKQFR